MADFTINVRREGDVGVLEWNGATDAETLAKAVSVAADDQLVADGVRRLEVAIPTGDEMARRALHLAGFRREGIRRSAMQVAPGEYVDAALYSRLATDMVTGPAMFSSVMNTVLPSKRTIAHVVFRNAVGEVLLLETTYKADWELPGGVVEPGEPPRVGAEREVAEEIGLEVQLHSPVLVDWMPPYLGWSDAMEYLYDGGVLDDQQIAAFVTQEREVRAAHWVPREQLAERVSPLSARRLELVLDGFHGFTEDGVPV